MSKTLKLKDGDQCTVVGGSHVGKSGTVRDINTSKTGHITITVIQKDGVRFKTLGRNVEVKKKAAAKTKKKVDIEKKAARGEKNETINTKVNDLYRKLVATNKEIDLKGKTLLYTSYNGHMFSALYQDGTVGIRLPEEERTAFLKKFKTDQPLQSGTVLKEYVLVPMSLLRKTAEVKKYFAKSFEYVKGLKTKKG
jgi:hypothetical protein